jgi:hypothetical protein
MLYALGPMDRSDHAVVLSVAWTHLTPMSECPLDVFGLHAPVRDSTAENSHGRLGRVLGPLIDLVIELLGGGMRSIASVAPLRCALPVQRRLRSCGDPY